MAQRKLENKVIVITGGSAGIGKAAAIQASQQGAKVLLVARDIEKLNAVKQIIEQQGGLVDVYAADITQAADVQDFIDWVIERHGVPDILVNNAGRSIRRSIAQSYDRMHDFERTMNVNYFAAVRLILGFLPHMSKAKRGHIINISSIGVLTRVPRFAAYVASKAALDTFSRSVAHEYAHRGIHFTTIHMPLVRTEMIAPTKIYRNVPALSPTQAAQKIVHAMYKKPVRMATFAGMAAATGHAIAPQMTKRVMNFLYRNTPEK